ncbi:MAG TPA: amidohydrolase family protein [Longimicrobiales bacterium]|nr:amidohydrolase family protein [Longimicrobiales bacterium]
MRRILPFLLVALAASAGPVASQQVDLAIVGGMLIDGNEGTPIQNSVILVSGDRIVDVGRVGTTAVPAGARVIDANGRTVMPGLVESHGHLMIIGHGDYSEWFPRYEDRIMSGEILRLAARQLIWAGVTTVRDVGAPLEPSVRVRDEIAAGRLDGPRLFVSGPFIVRGFGNYDEYFQVKVNSVNEARRAAINLLEGGADLLKPWGHIFPEDLKVIVEEARKRGKTVATHGGPVDRIRADVEAGVTSIEHFPGGSKSYIEPEAIELIVNSGTWVVPSWNGGPIYHWTLAYPERLDDPLLREFLPEDLYRDIRASVENFQRLSYFRGAKGNPNAYRDKLMQLYRGGARIALGTDSGTPMNFHYEAMWQQMKVWVDYGMDPMHVLSAATRHGAEILRLAHEFGTIEPGKLADIIVVDGNPLMDMMALRDPVVVIKDGRVLKNRASARATRADLD